MTYRMQVLQSTICNQYNISAAQLHSGSRKSEIVSAKRMLFFFARKHFKKTYQNIADMFGMNHASVIHHERKMEGFLTFDKQEMKNYIAVRDMVFDENSFIDIQDEYDCLWREKILIEDRMSEIKNEINLLNNKNNYNYGN
jgi:hypothetical protein|tara:strand:+ start:439 stop:861 length:423 start_codon:yes stop_codon:yes gene_type:complete